MAHETDSPQVKDSSRADAEWKADPGLSNLVHGSDGSVSPATPMSRHRQIDTLEPGRQIFEQGRAIA
ncbi:hypothetical protein V501_00078 [Pseudogymnoascus sp. VKM F-4519 (FW-2642)]|nr:hypothetical protein V501_00078 [Pseudogymnoascus sp. VKM F-4519 (FW-2642)]